MKVFLFEPHPDFGLRICTGEPILLVGTADSLDASLEVPESDALLVSAAFAAIEIHLFLGQARRADGPIVIVEVEEEPSVVLPFLEAGAAGYVRFGAPVSEVAFSLSEIRSGRLPLAPAIGEALLDRMYELLEWERRARNGFTDSSALEALTMRELQVLKLIRAGASNREIAQELLIELGTVKNHVHNILKKLNVSRRAQAAQYINLLEQIG